MKSNCASMCFDVAGTQWRHVRQALEPPCGGSPRLYEVDVAGLQAPQAGIHRCRDVGRVQLWLAGLGSGRLAPGRGTDAMRCVTVTVTGLQLLSRQSVGRTIAAHFLTPHQRPHLLATIQLRSTPGMGPATLVARITCSRHPRAASQRPMMDSVAVLVSLRGGTCSKVTCSLGFREKSTLRERSYKSVQVEVFDLWHCPF